MNPDIPPSGTKFPLGRTVATRGALAELAADDLLSALCRHSTGDWGDVCTEDWAENEFSLKKGYRLFSVYRSSSGVKFYVITESDRSATTILLPHEY